MDKDVIHTHTHDEILFIHKKKGNPAICNNIMDLEDTTLSKISQKEREKYCMISLPRGIWKKKSQTHRNK